MNMVDYRLFHQAFDTSKKSRKNFMLHNILKILFAPSLFVMNNSGLERMWYGQDIRDFIFFSYLQGLTIQILVSKLKNNQKNKNKLFNLLLKVKESTSFSCKHCLNVSLYEVVKFGNFESYVLYIPYCMRDSSRFIPFRTIF